MISAFGHVKDFSLVALKFPLKPLDKQHLPNSCKDFMISQMTRFKLADLKVLNFDALYRIRFLKKDT